MRRAGKARSNAPPSPVAPPPVPICPNCGGTHIFIVRCAQDPWVYCGNCCHTWLTDRRIATAIELAALRARNEAANKKREKSRRMIGSVFVYS